MDLMFQVHVMLVLVWDIDGITWRWRNFYIYTKLSNCSLLISEVLSNWMDHAGIKESLLLKGMVQTCPCNPFGGGWWESTPAIIKEQLLNFFNIYRSSSTSMWSHQYPTLEPASHAPETSNPSVLQFPIFSLTNRMETSDRFLTLVTKEINCPYQSSKDELYQFVFLVCGMLQWCVTCKLWQ